jgi:hypothetical protein
MSDPRAKPAATPIDEEDPRAETVRPPFDPETYARESESNIRIETLPPSHRPTAPPPPDMPQYQPGITSGTMQSLGSVTSDAVPVLAVAREDLEWFDLPQVNRSLVGLVDGRRSIVELARHAGAPLDRAMASFHEMARDGIVTLRR